MEEKFKDDILFENPIEFEIVKEIFD